MKSLVFDSGPLISLTSNNLLWLLEPLKKQFKGSFILPESVKSELVDEHIQTKKFKFEALQVQEYINKGILQVYEDKYTKDNTLELLKVANNCFTVQDKKMNLVHYAEIAALATALQLNSEAVVMDERVTREFVEHPLHLAKLTEKKIHANLKTDKVCLSQFKNIVQGVDIIRSTELAAIAFEKGLLKRYTSPNLKNSQKTVLESILWGLKLDGAAINERGIRAIVAAEMKRL